MISAGDFRNGATFEVEGNVYTVIDFQHVKPGKGAAFVRTKLRNVMAGSVVERTFNPSDRFPTAFIERKDMEYSYMDGGLYYFMDPESYEMVPIDAAKLDDNFRFVKENMTCKVLSYKGNVFGIEPPTFVTLQITKTDPGFERRYRHQRNKARYSGDRCGNQVPLFIDEGEMINIDTRSGEYMSRA